MKSSNHSYQFFPGVTHFVENSNLISYTYGNKEKRTEYTNFIVNFFSWGPSSSQMGSFESLWTREGHRNFLGLKIT